MKYYIDCEFLEGSQDKKFLGFKYGETKPTIDLISIGIVAEDGREYYAVSKDFNLKEAWNRYDLKPDINNGGCRKAYWIRDNVLIPISKNLTENDGIFAHGEDNYFTYKRVRRLIKKYGKSNKQIAEEVKRFVYAPEQVRPMGTEESIEFYGYYADYDWVVFCWLFGNMVDLPRGFPMHCIDLKQVLDEKAESLTSFKLSRLAHTNIVKHNVFSTYDSGVLECSKTDLLKRAINYPKQANEHYALSDARWNKKLHDFLQTL